MSIILISLYILSCWITTRGLFSLSSISTNPKPRGAGLQLIGIAAIGRFIILYIAYSGGFPLSYAIIAQFFPLLCLLVTGLILAISDKIDVRA